jgi:hypothetical protein
VPRADIHDEFERIAPLAIVDTVATTGEGVREAFVFAVRLALDRVRALSASHRLPEGAPTVDGAAALLRELEPLSVVPLPGTEEAARLAPLPAAAPIPELEHLLSEPPPPLGTVTTVDDERLFVPDPLMPGGFIWPPVDGRMLLHEVARLERTPTRTPSGDWWASGEGWRFHSAASALFLSADRGRQELIEWARLHAANLHRLSPGRTVILADAGHGRFRLWQLVRVSHALRERLLGVFEEAPTSELARELEEAAHHLLRARSAFNGGDVCLPCTLWTVSGDLQRYPKFVGLMPKAAPACAEETTESKLLEREFRPLLRQLRSERDDYRKLVSALAGDGIADSVTAQLFRLAASEVERV